MMSAESPSAKKPEIEVPAELLAALKPHEGLRPQDLNIESLKPSLFGRLAALVRARRR
jgi:hypothetical protein